MKKNKKQELPPGLERARAPLPNEQGDEGTRGCQMFEHSPMKTGIM